MKTLDFMEMPKTIFDQQSVSSQPFLLTLPGEGQDFLLAEANGNGDMLIQKAFSAAGMDQSLHVVPDGETAMNYLRGSGDYGDRQAHPIPKVVVLNMDLPRKNGFEVLGWMRTQSDFKALIIVIFTALNREAEADRARAMGADYYLTKPNTFNELVEMTRCLYGWVLGRQASVKTLHAFS